MLLLLGCINESIKQIDSHADGGILFFNSTFPSLFQNSRRSQVRFICESLSDCNHLGFPWSIAPPENLLLMVIATEMRVSGVRWMYLMEPMIMCGVLRDFQISVYVRLLALGHRKRNVERLVCEHTGQNEECGWWEGTSDIYK